MVEPTQLQLPVDDMSVFETLEGMYVEVVSSEDEDTDIVISEYYNFDQYGEVVVCNAEDRIFQFTETSEPSVVGFEEHVEEIERSCVTIDDNSSSRYPALNLFGGISEYEVTKDFTFRGGDKITTLKGPLFYSFGKWRVQPMNTNELAFTQSERPLSPPAMESGDLKLVFANVYNYWTTLGPAYELRGADSEAEFARQRAKTSLAFALLDADIFAVAEVENNAESTDHLVQQLNAHPSKNDERDYAAVTSTESFDQIGDDAIRVDMIYDSNKYGVHGHSLLTDANVSQEYLDQAPSGIIFNGLSRVPLAVTFEDFQTAKLFTVVVTHFKSKGGNGSGLDDDNEDGSGNYSFTRKLSTLALKTWLSSNP